VSAIGVALVAFTLLTAHRPPRPDGSLHRAVGTALATQTLNLLPPHGRVTILARDTETFRQPALDLLLSALQKKLRSSGKSASVRRLQVDPLRPMEVPPGELFEVIRRSHPGDVIVSLLGPPLLSEEQWGQVQPLKPKLVAFCPGNFAETIDLNRLFDAGFLHAAVVSRTWPPEASASTRTVPREFDELYLKVTASDRSPVPSAAPPSS
jgi:hypothetical protein